MYEDKALTEQSHIFPECVQERILGMFNTDYVWLRKGRYGIYVECENDCARVNVDKNKDLFSINLSIDDAIELLKQAKFQSTLQSANVLRMLDSRSSIRVGKYGHYIFYWPPNANKPRSISLKKCPLKYLDCLPEEILDWVRSYI